VDEGPVCDAQHGAADLVEKLPGGDEGAAAPPSSASVSEMPEAAPARSGGAEPTISSVFNLNTGARPSEITTQDVTSRTRPSEAPTRSHEAHGRSE
jgi:hypothetical protein